MTEINHFTAHLKVRPFKAQLYEAYRVFYLDTPTIRMKSLFPILLLALPLLAQSNTGELRLKVTDPSGLADDFNGALGR